MSDGAIDLAAKIRNIPDFPKQGILFRDIMPLLQDPTALREAVDRIVEYGVGKHVDVVLGAEARGFILGAADRLRPRRRLRRRAQARQAAVRDHRGRVRPRVRDRPPRDPCRRHQARPERARARRPPGDGRHGARQDRARRELGGKVVGLAFIVELLPLHGRDKLEGYDIFSLVQY